MSEGKVPPRSFSSLITHHLSLLLHYRRPRPFTPKGASRSAEERVVVVDEAFEPGLQLRVARRLVRVPELKTVDAVGFVPLGFEQLRLRARVLRVPLERRDAPREIGFTRIEQRLRLRHPRL